MLLWRGLSGGKGSCRIKVSWEWRSDVSTHCSLPYGLGHVQKGSACIAQWLRAPSPAGQRLGLGAAPERSLFSELVASLSASLSWTEGALNLPMLLEPITFALTEGLKTSLIIIGPVQLNLKK